MLHAMPNKSVVRVGRNAKRNLMTDQNEQHNDKSERRAMWIMTVVGVVIILGLMGMNMLTHPDWMHGG
jgi:hypothetical protein